MHALAVNAQPKGIRLRRSAEPHDRGAALCLYQAAKLIERQWRGFALGPGRLGGLVWTNEQMRQRCQVGQKVSDRATRQRKCRVRRIRIGEAARTENVETDEDLDMCHRPELA